MRNRPVYLFVLLSLTLSGAQARAVGSPPLANLSIQSIACPDARTCFAVGTRQGANNSSTLVVMATRDGGTGWTTVRTQTGFGYGYVSCPDSRRCYVVGASYAYAASAQAPPTLLRTADGGKTWQRSTLSTVQAGFSPAGLACPAAAVCYLAGTVFSPSPTGPPPNRSVLQVTRDSGKTWANLALRAATRVSLLAIACAGATTCEVGGVATGKSCFQAAAILRTEDGGKTWSRQFGDCAAAIRVLACPSALTCYAGGWYGDATGNQLVIRTGNGGASWDDTFEGPIDPTYQQGRSYSNPFAGIACPDPQTCFLAGDRYLVSTADGGATWSVKKPVRNASLTAIACPTTRFCLAVGTILPTVQGPGPVPFMGLILRTLDGGKTWKRL